jgi:hypothetical protein
MISPKVLAIQQTLIETKAVILNTIIINEVW